MSIDANAVVLQIHSFTAMDVMWYALKSIEPKRPRNEVADKLTCKVFNLLYNAGFEGSTLEELLSITEEDFIRIKNSGKKSAERFTRAQNSIRAAIRRSVA